MSGIGEAAAIIGVAQAAQQSIKSTYDFVQAIRDAPEAIVGFRDAIGNLEGRLKSLTFLDGDVKDATTHAEVEMTGVGPAINACGEACVGFQRQLDTWIKNDSGSLRDSVRIVLHKKTINKHRSIVETADKRLQAAIGILTL